MQLAGLWEEKLKEEQVKTGPLEEVCAALREALDAEHKKRMDVFETKMKPIIIKDGPSKKVSIIFWNRYTHIDIFLSYLVFHRFIFANFGDDILTKNMRTQM